MLVMIATQLLIHSISLVVYCRINSVSNSQVRGEVSDGGCLGPIGAKIWFFTGFSLLFGSLIAAAWILFGLFVVNNTGKICLRGHSIFVF